MTANTVISVVRARLKDEDGGNYRFLPEHLLAYLLQGVHLVAHYRPDLLLQANGTIDSIPSSLVLGTALPFDEAQQAALSNYVMYQCLTEDDEDTQNRAGAEMAFRAFLTELGVHQ